jgi:FkbM family methyltransferase
MNIIKYLRIIKKYYKAIGFKGIIYSVKGIISGKSVLLKKGSITHPFSLRVPSSDVLVYDQIFVEEEYGAFLGIKPKLIIDAGANIGLASIYFSMKYPESKIIAIEPDRDNFNLMKKNIEPYPNIIPVLGALWDKNEMINLVDPGLGNWGFMVDRATSKQSNSSRIKGMTIDKIISDYNIEEIDILKIDIEGSEKEVFSDTTLWIDKVNVLIVELHERMKSGCNRSFYNGTNDHFIKEWHQGENVYLSKLDLHV